MRILPFSTSRGGSGRRNEGRGRGRRRIAAESTETKIRRRKTTSTSALSAIPAVLVASLLVINVNAAPPALRTQSPSAMVRHRPSYSNNQKIYDRDGNKDERVNLRWVALDRNPSKSSTDQGLDNIIINESLQHSQPSRSVMYFKRDEAYKKNDTQRRPKHDSIIFPETGSNGTKTLNVPASFTSSLADSWEPLRRSVWFQRKAVIITSVFLAIFIVLIIGAAVFLRDKRHDSLEEDYDVSDEAALERMREERDMRLGSRSEKRKKKKGSKKKSKHGDLDDADDYDGGDGKGATTAIIASRWSRLPIRKIRLRKKRVSDESKSDVISDSQSRNGNGSNQIESMHSANQRTSLEDRDQTPSATLTHTSSGTNGLEQLPPLPPSTEGENEVTRTSTSASGSSPGLHPSSTRAPLTAEDLDYADQIEERMLLSDALPPAYIPNQERSNASSSNSALNRLHPIADRRLAGRDEEYIYEARGDRKVGLHNDLSDDRVEGASHEDDPNNQTIEYLPSDPTHLQVHIATDDKSVLSRLNQAASQPAPSTPLYASHSLAMGEASGSNNAIASAPVIDEEDEEVNAIRQVSAEASSSMSKGKDVYSPRPASALPAPPAPHHQSSFSRFDLPYTVDSFQRRGLVSKPLQEYGFASQNSAPIDNKASEKAKEAAEEERQAAALLASRPDEERILPQYEREEGDSSMMMSSSTMQPSAPVWDEEEEGDAIHATIEASAPSTP